MTLAEGQNREIRRLFARVGVKVRSLERVALGPLHLGRLPPGQFRALGGQEILALRRSVRLGAATARAAPLPSPSQRSLDVVYHGGSLSDVRPYTGLSLALPNWSRLARTMGRVVRGVSESEPDPHSSG